MNDEALRKLQELEKSLIDPDLVLPLFEQAPDATVVVETMTGNIVMVNRQAEFMFGYHRSEMIGNSIGMLMPEHVREAHGKHRVEYATNPRTRPMGIGLNLQGRNKAGLEFRVEINLSPVITRHGSFTIATVRRPNG